MQMETRNQIIAVCREWELVLKISLIQQVYNFTENTRQALDRRTLGLYGEGDQGTPPTASTVVQDLAEQSHKSRGH
jgi:homoserine dehydrogenase